MSFYNVRSLSPLNKLKAAHDHMDKSLLYTKPEKGRGWSQLSCILPDPVQIGKELVLVKEPLQVCLLGMIGIAGVKCCLKATGKYKTESQS